MNLEEPEDHEFHESGELSESPESPSVIQTEAPSSVAIFAGINLQTFVRQSQTSFRASPFFSRVVRVVFEILLILLIHDLLFF